MTQTAARSTKGETRHGALRTMLAGAFVIAFSATTMQCSSGSGDGGQRGFGGSTIGAGGGAGAGATGAGGSGAGTSTGGVGGTGGSGATGAGGSGATGTGGGGNLLDASGGNMRDYSAEDFFIDDPPPMACNGNMSTPVVPGGTPQCPDDKNLPGCPCDPDEPQPQPCWPGLRKHRNRGMCSDGETTCEQVGENVFEWGVCQTFSGIEADTLLPPDGATGKAACGCFSSGFWNLSNTSPCFWFSDPAFTQVIGATSTLKSTTNCPGQMTIDPTGSTPPGESWASDTVEADCSGFFKLCYTLKALSAPMAMRQSDTDCVVKEVCVEDQYTFAQGEDPPTVDFPDLPAWITDTASERACAQSFRDNGGYGEMSVEGESDECETVGPKIFQTVNYCPWKCNDPANAMDAECVNCTTGGGGRF